MLWMVNRAARAGFSSFKLGKISGDNSGTASVKRVGTATNQLSNASKAH
jgi:hypothetical protein